MRFLVWIVAALAVAVLGALGWVGWIWFASEAHLTSFKDPPPFTASIPTDVASLERGRHLAVTRGCAGCHGDRLEGEAREPGPWLGQDVAPGLAKLARAESPALIERAVRHGIGHDGRALYSMPAFNFVRMSDADMAALIGYLRAAPVIEKTLPKPFLAWNIRYALATGADAAIPAFVPKVPPLTFQADPNPAVRRGEYLAMTSCNECHGFGLRGDIPFADVQHRPPDLTMVAAYDKADFVRLMRTGKAAGNREVGLMSEVARSRFSHWTDQEVEDLYSFFGALNEKAAATPKAGNSGSPP